MYYYKNANESIEKYEVNFDVELLNNLKKEIIDNCSTIEHVECQSDYIPYDTRSTKEYEVRNLYSIDTGKLQEYWEESRSIYLYTYDKLFYPPLAIAINELIDGNIEAITEIFNYNEDNNMEQAKEIAEQISILSMEINKIQSDDLDEKDKKQTELTTLVASLNDITEIKPIYSYYKRVQELISLNLVDTISIEEIKRVTSFFEDKSFLESCSIKNNEEKGFVLKKAKKTNPYRNK